jgi:hypothetical protein
MRAQRAKKRPPPLTAFGEWLRCQPRGTPSEAMRVTGLAYSTVLIAKRRRMTRDVAEVLSAFTGGAVPVAAIVSPSRYARAASRGE